MGGPRNPYQKEKIIFEIINSSNKPIAFNEIAKIAKNDYNFTSGATQAAIERCLNPQALFPIFEKKVFFPENNRIIRFFSTNLTTFDEISQPSIDELLTSYQRIKEGEMIHTEEETILPLYLSKDQAEILEILVEKNDNFKSVGDLFSQALMTFLKNSITRENLLEAIETAREHKNQIKREEKLVSLKSKDRLSDSNLDPKLKSKESLSRQEELL